MSAGRGGMATCVGAILLAVGSFAHALHVESPPVVTLTNGATHGHSPGRSWGSWLAFASMEDLTGLGDARVAGWQIFLFNLAYYDCAQGTTLPDTPCPEPGTPWLVQVTNDAGEPANPSVAKRPSSAKDPFDVWIAFDALGTFGGLGGPAAGRRQIVLAHVASGARVQVTTAADGDSMRPSLSGNGNLVVFESTAAVAGFPNPAGVTQVMLYERASGLLRQLSVGQPPLHALPLGVSRNPMPNEGGTGVVFESSADLFGDGAETGVSQLFWADWDTGKRTATLHQLTSGNGPSGTPFASSNTREVVFESTATDLPGGSGASGRQLYAISVREPLAKTVEPLTDGALHGDCFAPAVDDSGDVVAFACSGDPLQNGTTGARLFALDRGNGTLYQLTGLGDVVGRPASNLGRWFVSVTTSSDLGGTGACIPQLHVVDFAVGGWGAATFPGQLPADATLANGCAQVCETAEECDDGNPCNGVEACSLAGLCAPGVPLACGDGDVCNGLEACDPATGACLPGLPLECDNGNPCTDDLCHPLLGCTTTPNADPCDDANACTTDDVCQAGECTGTRMACALCERCDPASGTCDVGPRTTCLGETPGMRSKLKLRDTPIDRADLLGWTWKRPEGTSHEDLGRPDETDDYALCLFDATDRLLLQTDAPAGGQCRGRPCWAAKDLGFLYRDRSGTPTGVTKVQLKVKASGGAKITLKAQGPTLVPPPLPIAPPMQLQLQNTAGTCWEAVYDAADVKMRDPFQLKAKVP